VQAASVVSPLFRLIFVSFLQTLHLSRFGKPWSSIGATDTNSLNTIASRDGD
jgi:hypothetical protein